LSRIPIHDVILYQCTNIEEIPQFWAKLWLFFIKVKDCCRRHLVFAKKWWYCLHYYRVPATISGDDRYFIAEFKACNS